MMAVTIGDIAGLMRAEDWIGVRNGRTGIDEYIDRAGSVKDEWKNRIVKSIVAIYMDGTQSTSGLLLEVEGE